MIRYIFSAFIFIIFSIYWFFTFIFTSPNNYINVSLLEYSYVFDTFFYQKWAFFAPPPNSNDRLIYYFEEKNNKQSYKVHEVIEPITMQKSKKAPFNTEEDILDYVLSNTIATIREEIVNINEIVKYRKNVEKKSITDDELLDLYHKRIDGGSSLETLKKYSYYVAKKNNIDLKKYQVKIIISSIEIPKFIHRNDKNFKRIENVLYESKPFELKNEKNN